MDENDLQEWRDEQAERRIERIQKLIPMRYRGADITDDSVSEWVETVLDGPKHADREGRIHGPSVLLLGPTGVGKTFEAFGLLKHMAEYGLRDTAKIATAADLYAMLRPRNGVDSEEVFEYFADSNLLLIDDLGAAKYSEWTEEVNYRLVNHRYNHQLTTIFTSNVPPKDLATHLGERVASRLTEMCDQVVLTGQDRRAAA